MQDIGIKDEDFLSLLEKRKSTEEKLKQQHELTNRERAEAKSGGQNEEEQNEEFYRRKAEIAMEIQQLQEKLKDSQVNSRSLLIGLQVLLFSASCHPLA